MVGMKRIVALLSGLIALGLGTSLVFAQAPVLDKFLFLPEIQGGQGIPGTPTPKSTPTPTEPPTLAPTRTATGTPRPTSNTNCNYNYLLTSELCIWVSNGTPDKNTDLTVFGRLIENGVPQVDLPMRTTWYYPSATQTCDTGVTDARGQASCTRNIGNPTSGVRINIWVKIGDRMTDTWFTPN